jgi:hypothetical protein
MEKANEKIFYQQLMPAMLKQIARLAEAMEKQNKINESLLLLEKKKFALTNSMNESATPKVKPNGKEAV